MSYTPLMRGKHHHGSIIFDASAAVARLSRTLKAGVPELVATASRIGVQKVSEQLEGMIQENIGYTDHSLADLKKLGHPYARRKFGATTVGAFRKMTYAVASSRGGIAGHAPHIVHRQGTVWGTGGGGSTLYDALHWWWEADNKDEISASVGIKETDAKHVRHVVYGTRYMVSRDFLTATLLENGDELLATFAQYSGLRKKS